MAATANGPEFVAKAVQEWIGAVGAKTAYISPGSPWENGFIESPACKVGDEIWRRPRIIGALPLQSRRLR
jgi:hypothetical protein